MTVCDVKQCRAPLDSGEKQRALSVQGRTYVVCADCLKVFEEFMERALEGDKSKARPSFVPLFPPQVEVVGGPYVIVDSPHPAWLPGTSTSTPLPPPSITYIRGGVWERTGGPEYIQGTIQYSSGTSGTPSP